MHGPLVLSVWLAKKCHFTFKNLFIFIYAVYMGVGGNLIGILMEDLLTTSTSCLAYSSTGPPYILRRRRKCAAPPSLSLSLYQVPFCVCVCPPSPVIIAIKNKKEEEEEEAEGTYYKSLKKKRVCVLCMLHARRDGNGRLYGKP